MTSDGPKTILFLTPFLDDNSIGRTYCLWLLARHLGWSTKVISFEGHNVWEPLADTEFAQDCSRVEARSRRSRVAHLQSLAGEADVVVAVKPLPGSLGLALSARAREKFALVADIDDPDLEARLSRRPRWKGFAWRMRHLSFWLRVRNPKRLAARVAVMVSNPTLQSRYGGLLVPHVREDNVVGSAHVRSTPTVAFVGTLRDHKGVDLIRDAVGQVAGEGFSLVITADAPVDAKAWETWTGRMPLAEGIALAGHSDIVVIPSKENSNAIGQLPVKLVDAMLLGRAVIVSDVDPMPWAVGDADLVVPPEDVASIVEKLLELADPRRRALVGAKLRERGLQLFTVEAVAPSFADACQVAEAL